MSALTFDMRGDRKAQPFGHPLDGRVRRHLGTRSNAFNSRVQPDFREEFIPIRERVVNYGEYRHGRAIGKRHCAFHFYRFTPPKVRGDPDCRDMRSFSVRVAMKVFGTIRKISGNSQRPVAIGLGLDRGSNSSRRVVFYPVLQVPAVLHEMMEIVIELD